MKISVVGGGAMGVKFAYRMVKAGMHCLVIDVNEAAVNRLKSGIEVTGSEGADLLTCEAALSPELVRDSDLIFLFVKSYSTRQAMASIAEYISERSVIVTLQNGLGNYEIIKEFADEKNIVLGSTTEGAALIDDRLVMGGSGLTELGGSDMRGAEKAAALLDEAGFKVSLISDPLRSVWKKAVINSAINPAGAILNRTNGGLIEDEFSRRLLNIIGAESCRAAALAGMQFDTDEMTALVEDVCVKTSGNRCSMLQDITAGRRTEIDSINGKIIEAAERSGGDAPLNRSLYLLIKSMEASGIPNG